MNKLQITSVLIGVFTFFLLGNGCRAPGIVEFAPPASAQPPIQLTETAGVNQQGFPHSTPYALEPASGICSGPVDQPVVELEITPEVPSPRCLRVNPFQKLQVTNLTEEEIHLRVGPYDQLLEPGARFQTDEPFEAFLMPGVHHLEVTPYTGPELWLGEAVWLGAD